MARVFISYRRIDSKWAVGRLYDRLSEVLDGKNLFLDVSDIEPGEDYVEKIEAVVRSCDVLLAVIGQAWLTTQDSTGRRRLDDPKDWVRVEISTALSRGIRVIPILIDEAEMPDRFALPEDLIGLSRRNAKLISFSHFHSDLDSLLRVLEKVLAPVDEPTSEPTRPKSKQTEPRTVTSKPAVSESPDIETVESPPPPQDSYLEVPLTICLETKGGIATPLIFKGTSLPTDESKVFSTAEDNQEAVTVKLVWGERQNAEDNLSLGTFDLQVPPAKRGIPQIEITTSIDTNLIMTVTAKDKGTGKIEILDAVDLSHVDIPEDMSQEALENPRRKESNRDINDIFSNLGFEDFFTTNRTKPPRPKNDRPANSKTCSNCGGTGQVSRPLGLLRLPITCPLCKGDGFISPATDNAEAKRERNE